MRDGFIRNSALGALAALLVVGLSIFLHRDFRDLDLLVNGRIAEKKAIFEQLTRLRTEPLAKAVADYTLWDDMVRYVRHPSEQWVRNEVDVSLETFNFNGLWLYRADGTLLHALFKEKPGQPHRETLLLPIQSVRTVFAGGNPFPRFFIRTDRGVMEIFGAGIFGMNDPQRRGQPAGYLLAGTLWDRRQLAELGRLTGCSLTLDEPTTTDGSAAAPRRKDRLTFFRPLPGFDGKPVGQLQVSADLPDVQHLLRNSTANAIMEGLLIAGLLTMVIFALISRQRLHKANRSRDLAQRLAQAGSWERDPASGVCSWSANQFRIFGLAKAGTIPSLEAFYRLVHPEDLERVRETIERATRERTGYEVTFRLIRPDGELRWMTSKGEMYSFDGLSWKIVGSTQDVTEFTMIENRLATIVKQKDMFISRLGHDLKTPLTPLTLLLPLIREMADDGEIRRMAEICTDSARHMQNITGKYLKLARLTTAVSHHELLPVNLTAAAAGSCTEFAETAGRRRITLDNRISGDLDVLADPAQIEELFANLLDNAVKFSPPESAIVLEAIRQEEMIVVMVQDRGIGLEPHQTEHIFDELYKADDSRHETGAPGLGLSISKRIVLNHGGTIRAASPGKDQGTTISFTLPAAGRAHPMEGEQL
ncbi:hypothetical protein GURASL_38400 [Geotalea uraniireducens]|uniref:histidine kinase n=1 Tax=Geotalea uraniireducens TaxID=351604 RepID=A0ABM8EQX5_9BACT|nr:ATP-binding protein [Geotalea uraniireducens]BDV44917.1 hypothetical protein GURASL_38400 [Geotalea uraniireducens]